MLLAAGLYADLERKWADQDRRGVGIHVKGGLWILVDLESPDQLGRYPPHVALS